MDWTTAKPFVFTDIEARVRAVMLEQATDEEKAALRLAQRLLKRTIAQPASLDEAKALIEELRAAGYELVVEDRTPTHYLGAGGVSHIINGTLGSADGLRIVAYKRVEADREPVNPAPFMQTFNATGE